MKYSFGTIHVDAGARTIGDAGRPVHLTRKAFDLLILLLDSRPNAVTKDQIFARLWPDTFVSEASLQTLIHEIRQAIDTGGAHSSWVRTVRGVGYSFAGEVLVSDATPAKPSAAAWLLGETTTVSLAWGENVLGRGSDGVIEIDHPSISRRHARIVIEDAAAIEDLGSKNGTWLNDTRLSGPHPLADGDIVSLGSVRLTFRRPQEPGATATVELNSRG